MQQSRGGRKIYPGYYWLAYEWSNLLVSCELCNRARKRNLFPLRNPAHRASSAAGIPAEDPMLLDPAGGRDPREHIRFVGNAPSALTDVGQASIDAYFLDRPHLSGLRVRRLREAERLQQVVALASASDDPEHVALAAEARAELEAMTSPAAEFSAMVRDHLAV